MTAFSNKISNDTNTTSEELTVFTYSELEHILMSGSLVLIILVTLIGNATVCLAVYRRRKLRTRTNMFIINLSCADIGVAVLCMPFSLITCLRHDWVLGDALCKINGFFNIVFGLTSLLTLTGISVETYFAICKPLYHRHMSRNFALGLLTWTWFQPVAIAIVPFFDVINYEFKPGTTQCGVQFPTNLAQIIYAGIVIFCGFVLPVSIMGFAYSNIFCSARQHTRRVSRVSISSTSSTNSATAHRQVAVTVLILLGVFLACWFPYFMYVILVSAEKELSTERAVLNLGKAGYWCAFASSALNPYIYGFRNPQFRKEFNLILCYLCPCVGLGSRSRGCSTTTGSKGSWDGSGGFDYNQLRRPSTPCITPKGRLSVDFAPLPQESLQKLEMFALQAKLSNCSAEPEYCSHNEESSEAAIGDENVKNNGEGDCKINNNITNTVSGTNVSESRDDFFEINVNETGRSHHKPLEEERSIKGSFCNQGFAPESNSNNSIAARTNECENSAQADSLDSFQAARDLGTSLSKELLPSTRPRGWSLRSLGARLKLGWVESAL